MKIVVFLLSLHLGITFILVGTGVLKLKWKEGVPQSRIKRFKIASVIGGIFIVGLQILKFFI